MPRPIALCLEDLDARHANVRYHQCVALQGRLPGLGISAEGALAWQDAVDLPVSAELWVSADERLILYRREGGAPILLRRGGRSLDVPFEKPVVLLGGDQIEVGGRRFKLHVHGDAPTIHPPRALIVEAERPRTSTATLVALAAIAVGACGAAEKEEEPPKVEVRDMPPAPPLLVDDPPPKTTQPPPEETPPPIEVIPSPPQVPAPEVYEQMTIPTPQADPPVKPGPPAAEEPPPIEVRPMPPAVAPPGRRPPPPPPPPRTEEEDKKDEGKKEGKKENKKSDEDGRW
jgi:hypothetical protein